VLPSDSPIFLFSRVSKTKDIHIQGRPFTQDPTDIAEAGTLTIASESSSNYPDNLEDNSPQYNYHTSASQVCDGGFFSPDNTLLRLSSRLEGNAPVPDDYSESSLMVSGDQKSQHTRDSAGQNCHRLSKSLDMIPVVSGNVGAEVVKDTDWHHKPEGNIKAEAHPTNNAPSSVKRELSYGELALRSIINPKLQNLQRSSDETPSCANLAKETTKRYDESSTIHRVVGEAGDEVSVLSKHQHSGLLDVPSSPELDTEQAAPNTLSAPIDKAGIGSWVSDANLSDSKPPFPHHLEPLNSLSHDERQRTLTQSGSKPSGSHSRQSECHPSKGASGTSQNGTTRKRKRSLGGGGNGEVPNDENDEGDDSTQRTSDKSPAEYLKKGLACPFYKNDPVYFANDLFHDGKFFICAARGFPNIARLK
jgi:hypothetical protein